MRWRRPEKEIRSSYTNEIDTMYFHVVLILKAEGQEAKHVTGSITVLKHPGRQMGQP